jgi:hypothetical protein
MASPMFAQSSSTPAQAPPKIIMLKELPAAQTSSDKGQVYGAKPEHPATEDQIREYLSLVGLARVARTSMATMIRSNRLTAAPYYPNSYWDDMDAELQKIDIVSLYVPIYQEYLSTEEMQGVIDFYRSPAGKKLLNVQPLIVSSASVLMRQKGEEIGKAVYARHKDEIEAAKREYDSRHVAPATK